MSGTKNAVALHVFPSLDYMEIVSFGEKTGDIQEAGSLPAFFDVQARLMVDEDQMIEVVRDLYNSHSIPLNTPTVLVLPSFFTRQIDLPPEFDNEEIQTALVSESERFYMFKKSEAQVSWLRLNDTDILYSAYPKAEIEKYLKIFNTLNIPLHGIDINYFALIRGLVATGAVAGEVEQNATWALLTVTDYAFSAIVCQGQQIVKAMEAPLSIQSNDEMSIIQEIQQDFAQFMDSEALTKVVLVNNTDRVTTNRLLNQLNLPQSMMVFEQHGGTLRSRGVSDAPFPCSLEALGGVFFTQLEDTPQMNLLPKGGAELVVLMNYRRIANRVLILLNVMALVLFGVVFGIMSIFVSLKEGEIKSLNDKIASGMTVNVTGGLSQVKRRLFVKDVFDRNVGFNDLLVQVGVSIPKEMWVSRIWFTMQNDKPAVTVEGGALIVDPLNAFLSDLNKALKRDDLQVAKADATNTPDGQTFFSWVIQNKQDKPPAPSQ
ncbi:MAG: hypothetical protein K2X01_01535 [Cyanobacteria bacterium]|nr:hypothetical protein [Cyanobacteriota bacterium]